MPADNKPLDPKPWTVHDLWAKYEDVAMHFNDLLIRLRTQALAGVAAISTLVGIFTRTDPASATSIHISWQIASDVFVLLMAFWAAIWVIDRCYYNRLLTGAVEALHDIEQESTKANPSLAIDLSTKIELHVAHPFLDKRPLWERFHSKIGVWLFYLIVFCALIAGSLVCYRHE
jgi:hypothetical protein